MKALREEIDAVLRGKLDTAIKDFQSARNQDLEELAGLKKAVEKLEAERADLQKQMGGLNTRKASDMAEYNRLDGKLRWLDRQVKGKGGQIDALFTKLTDVEIDAKTLNLFLHFQGVKDA